MRLPEADPSQEAADSLLPAVTYRRLPETKREPHQKGAGSLVTASYLFRSMAADYPTAKTVADTLRLVLDGFPNNDAGPAAARPCSGQVVVTRVALRDDFDEDEQPVHGDEQGEFAVAQISKSPITSNPRRSNR